jgi:GNAT superfamily N-acetyltransferase
MRIRRAHESEADVLSGIARESKAYWAYSAAQLAAWRGELTISPGTVSSLPVYVAEVEARIVGFFVVAPSAPHWTLEHFWVSPSAIGRGVGRALLSRASAIAAEGGATKLAVDADPNAEPFYVACGARRVGSLPAPIEGSPDRVRPQLLLSTQQPETRF